MIRKMFFCYERNLLGKWEPVVYYDEVPALNSGGKESVPTRSTIWPVPEDCINVCDGIAYERDEPRFGKLQKTFRAPA